MRDIEGYGIGMTWWRAIFIAGTAVIISWFLVTCGTNLSLDISTLSGILFVVVTLAATAGALYHRRSLLDRPIYLALYAYVLFIGIGPLLSDMIPADTILAHGSVEPSGRAIVMLWAGLAALILGYKSVRREVRQRKDRVISTTTGQTNAVLTWGGIVLTLIGIGGTVVFLASSGGFSFLFETAYGTREYPAFFVATSSMLRPGLFLFTAWALAREKRSLLVWISLFVYTYFDLLWFGPVSGSRSQIITLVLTLVCLASFIPTRGMISVKGLICPWLIVAGLILTVVWGGLRTHSIEELASSGPADLNVIENAQLAAAKTLYAPYQGFLGILDLVPSKVPFARGQTLVDSVTLFIPRALWTSKPGSFGVWLAETLYGPAVASNAVPTWPGELYFNFGWIGLTLGMVATGVACAFMTRLRPRQCEAGCDVWRGLMAALWFPFPFIWIWGGSNTAVWHVLFNVLPIWVVFKIAPLFRGGRAPSRYTAIALDKRGSYLDA